MRSIRFSVRARDDLREIGAYTVRTWNDAQAIRYLAQLEDHARALVGTPALGRRCEHIRPGLWRTECGSHVLFFRRVPDGVFVCRILHQRMLPESQPIDDDDDPTVRA